jgi:Domain of unknown function (DUF1877)
MSTELYLHHISPSTLDLLEEYPGLVDVFLGYYEISEYPEPFSFESIQQLQANKSFIQEYYPDSTYQLITPEIFEQVQRHLPKIAQESQNLTLCLGDMRSISGSPATLNWFLTGVETSELCHFLAKYDETMDLSLVNAVFGGREIGNISGHGYLRCLSFHEVQTVSRALGALCASDLEKRWTTLCQKSCCQPEAAEIELENLRDSVDEITAWYDDAVRTEQSMVIYLS